MLTTALAQVKGNFRRFVAIILALGIAVAFVQASLMLNNIMKDSLIQTLAADISKTDIVIKDANYANTTEANMQSIGVTEAQYKTAKETPGVVASSLINNSYTSISTQANKNVRLRITPAMDSQLTPYILSQGKSPTADNEGVLDSNTAQSYGVSLGQDVTVPIPKPVTAAPAQDTAAALAALQTGAQTEERKVKIVGIADTKANNAAVRPTLFASDNLVTDLAKAGRQSFGIQAPATAPPAETRYRGIYLKVQDPAKAEDIAKELQNKLGTGVKVETKTAYLDELTKTLSSGLMLILGALWLFILISLFVAALVVSNTFTVLLAQRTRELGLLRTIGAKGSQIKNSVLCEAGLVGLIASIIGTIFTFVVMRYVVSYAQDQGKIPKGFVANLTPLQMVAGAGVGIFLSLAASYLPAQKATKVTPLQALQPLQEATFENKQGKIKIGIGLLLLVSCLGLMTYSLINFNIYTAIAGGVAGSLALLLLSGVIIPAMLGTIAKVLPDSAITSKMASLNSMRNPRRSATTATALLIGVTLVSMIVTGAHIAKTSMSQEMAIKFSVDIELTATPDKPFDQESLKKVQDNQYISAATLASSEQITIDGKPDASLIVNSAEFPRVARNAAMDAQPGEIIVPLDKNYPDTLKVTGTNGEVTLKVKKADFGRFNMHGNIMSQDDYSKINPAPASSLILAQAKDSISDTEANQLSEDLPTSLGLESSTMGGTLIARTQIYTIINTLLTGIIGLLGISIVIAVIGIGNTVSLSVIERTRESALLRALGITKRQLRSMLVQESLFIAGTATVLGLVVGVLFGIAGIYCLLGKSYTIVFTLPWGQLALILGLGALAGIIATLLPSRRATKLSPVEGLASQ